MNLPKNDHKYTWTYHSKGKLIQYGIGPGLVKRIIRHPERKEEGIAEQTIAVMKTKGKKNTQEVWVMYQIAKSGKRKVKSLESKTRNSNPGKIIIISAWIYPGVSPKGKEIFVPDEVWDEISKLKDKS